jgi:hypothetical protein
MSTKSQSIKSAKDVPVKWDKKTSSEGEGIWCGSKILAIEKIPQNET